MHARTILLYAQDNQGLGHINRTLTIARGILASHPDVVAYIATKSAVASHFELPARCDYVKLPTFLAPDPCQLSTEETEAEKQRFRTIRARILRDAALGLKPSLVLVDHEPLGSKGEFRDGLCALKAERPETRFVFGLRDIMDDPARIRETWREMGVYGAFNDLYDGIAVYGSPALYDVSQAYGLPEPVRRKLHYCGYVVRDLPTLDPAAVRQRHQLPANGKLVLATVGSGFDGYPVLKAAQAAVGRLNGKYPNLFTLLVTGPLMPPAEQASLRAGETSAIRVVSHADVFQLMTTADAVLCMGGYNSVCEALAVARPLVTVPRATHKIEQQIRAETLAAHGLARMVHPRDLSGERLAGALDWALGRDPRTHARLVRRIIPTFDGAARVTAYLSRWLTGD